MIDRPIISSTTPFPTVPVCVSVWVGVHDDGVHDGVHHWYACTRVHQPRRSSATTTVLGFCIGFVSSTDSYRCARVCGTRCIMLRTGSINIWSFPKGKINAQVGGGGVAAVDGHSKTAAFHAGRCVYLTCETEASHDTYEQPRIHIPHGESQRTECLQSTMMIKHASHFCGT